MSRRTLCMVVPLALAAACDDPIYGEPLNGGGGGGGDVEVEGEGWSALAPVFQAECAASCHSAGSQLGGLDLETDPCATLVDQPSAVYGAPLVASGDAAGSVLWNKMADTGTYGAVMPSGGALSAEVVDAVRDWIDAGASCDEGDTGGAR